mgnify:CR=1 FL=1
MVGASVGLFWEGIGLSVARTLAGVALGAVFIFVTRLIDAMGFGIVMLLTLVMLLMIFAEFRGFYLDQVPALFRPR